MKQRFNHLTRRFRNILALLTIVISNLSALTLGASPVPNEPLEQKDSYQTLMSSLATKNGISLEDLKRITAISLNFAIISAGDFTMGSPDGSISGERKEDGRNGDETQHVVSITRPFEIGKTEVTQLQYFLIMGLNPSTFVDARSDDYMEFDFVNPGTNYAVTEGVTLNANRPVSSVSWFDTQEFIRKLNILEAKYIYRLPTEAEWEYAARAGTTTTWSFENEKDALDYMELWDPKKAQAESVAIRKPNPFGLYNMHGNVSEWCSDWYSSTYSETVDPVGPDTALLRVIRGGSWFYACAANSRSALRSFARPGTPSKSVGFRLVRTAK